MSNNVKGLDIASEEYIIFASDMPQDITENYMRIENIGFKRLQGRYKGQNEISYIVNARDTLKITPMIEGQESILELSKIQNNGMRNAKLRFKDGTEKELGDMAHVTEQEAKASSAYTFDGQSYFIAG